MNSVEWLIEQLGWNNRSDAINRIVDEAKEMHKQEIIDASNGYTTTELLGVTKGEYYYQETFVSKGSYVNGDVVTKDSVIVELPKQEISDEEIEKGAEWLDNPIERLSWKEGAKWYREQLKCNGNGES